MNTILQSEITKIYAVLCVSVIGVLFFDWKLFDAGMLFILDIVVIYFVFNIHQYFVRKETRYPFIYATIQLAFSVIFFSGLSFILIIIFYELSLENVARLDYKHSLFPRLKEFNIPFVFTVLLILETISFYVRLAKDKTIENTNFFRVLQKLLFTYLFMVCFMIISLFVFMFSSDYLEFFCFLISKLIFDILMVRPDYFQHIKTKLLNKR